MNMDGVKKTNINSDIRMRVKMKMTIKMLRLATEIDRNVNKQEGYGTGKKRFWQHVSVVMRTETLRHARAQRRPQRTQHEQ